MLLKWCHAILQNDIFYEVKPGIIADIIWIPDEKITYHNSIENI